MVAGEKETAIEVAVKMITSSRVASHLPCLPWLQEGRRGLSEAGQGSSKSQCGCQRRISRGPFLRH